MSRPESERPVLEIDGARFDDLDGFYDEVSRQLIPGARWGRNLDAFNDILRGGFGTPEQGFVLRWSNSDRSRELLGSRFDTIVEIIGHHAPELDALSPDDPDVADEDDWDGPVILELA